MNSKGDVSPIDIPRNTKYNEIYELLPVKATSGSSESGLVSD